MPLLKISALIAVAVGVVWAFQKALATQLSWEKDTLEWTNERRAAIIEYERHQNEQ